jgi:light-regulated signal transduction histidine kinase (bacteriophytochrome)
MPALTSKVTRMRLRIPSPARRSARGLSPSDDDCVPLTSDSLHDLSSPVNQICSLSDLILKRYQDALDEEAKVLFGYLESSANRLQNLMGGLRTYMQVACAPPAYRHSDGNMLLAGALAMLQHAIARNGALVTHGPLPELWCDPSQMTYALACLIENAIKFRGERRPEIHVGTFSDKRSWVLSVSDNGMGIDPRYAGRIFAAFKRIHNDTYPGAGVGLAIAKRVIERHKGRIWVESELERGSTFYMELPKMNERGTKPSGEKLAVA